MRQQRDHAKPVIAPVGHVMGLSPSVCPVLMVTTWRVACVDSTVLCEHTLQMTAPADAVLPTAMFAQMTGPVSVSCGQLGFKRKNIVSYFEIINFIVLPQYHFRM